MSRSVTFLFSLNDDSNTPHPTSLHPLPPYPRTLHTHHLAKYAIHCLSFSFGNSCPRKWAPHSWHVSVTPTRKHTHTHTSCSLVRHSESCITIYAVILSIVCYKTLTFLLSTFTDNRSVLFCIVSLSQNGDAVFFCSA